MATTTSTVQTRSHGGHSHGHGHGHHHHHDNVYLTSQNKNDAGVRITRIGLYANLGMAVAKFAGGYVFSSQAMVADAWHSLTDLASDVLTLATVAFSLRPPTDSYPSGFGKVESLGSLGVSGMLLAGGVFMGMSSLETLYAHFMLDPAAAHDLLHHGHGHGHAHGALAMGPSIHAAWLALGTVLIKEWLYHATMKVAKERKSQVLASNAIHHRVDSWTGIVTMLVILGANILKDATWLDPVGGLFISFLVIRAGWGNTLSSLYELADRTVDDDVKRAVRRQATKCIAHLDQAHSSSGEEQVQVRDVSGIKSGQNYLVDVELAVPGEWTVQQVRAVEDAVRAQIGAKVRGVRKVRVRFVPRDAASKDTTTTTTTRFDEFIPGTVDAQSDPESEDEGRDDDDADDDNDDAHVHGNGHPKSQ
ncbi:cation efflux family-domain-containing protein [Coniella lustricola]|uniref:Cation efflux family-domain-containing protein n=1 Tax=Coniella lustricola TaxID=2025994 RepID=A0A2T2ZSR0_9PEZI|nr:cation efflux family-domain-containing protein [Coniella lustricola]